MPASKSITSPATHAGDEEKVIVGEDVVVVALGVPDTGVDPLSVTATLKADATVTEAELFLWCVDRLPYFALPRYIEFRAELPRSPVGRVLKRELRAEGANAATWDLETSGITYEKK